MAGKSSVVSVIITGAADGLKKAFGDAEKSAGGFSSSLAKLGPVAATGGLAVGAALFKIGSDFDEMADTIRVGTGATGAQLDALNDVGKNVLKDVPTNFADAGTAIADINTKLGLADKPLETVSKQFLELSRITGSDLATNIDVGSKALNAWGATADEQPGKLDYLFKVSQATGIGFDRLSDTVSKNAITMQELGFSFEDTAALAGQLTKSGVDVDSVFAGMKKSLATLAKAGEDPKEAFSRLNDEIKNAKDPTEAAQKAIALYGAKAGPQLAPLIRSGKLSVEDLAKSLSENTETILGAGEETQDWGEKLTKLKNQVFVALEPVATQVFNAIGTAVEKVTPLITGLTTFFQEHKNVAIAVAAVIGTVVVAAFAAWAISAAQAAVATIAATWPVLAIAAALAALVAGIIWAYQNWDWFRESVDKVRDAAVWLWENVLVPFGNWIKDSFIPAIADMVRWFNDHVVPAFRAVANFVKDEVIRLYAIKRGWWPRIRAVL